MSSDKKNNKLRFYYTIKTVRVRNFSQKCNLFHFKNNAIIYYNSCLYVEKSGVFEIINYAAKNPASEDEQFLQILDGETDY